MRVMLLVRVALVIALAGASVLAQDLSVELQRITQQATVTGDLRAAIEGYKRIVARAGTNREVAAQALVRMAESYQKLGDTEARAVYERIVREFSDRKAEAALASARLGSAGGTAPVATVKGDRAVWTGPNVDMTLSGRVSPDGRFIAWINYRLMMRDVTTNVDRALTPAGTGGQWPAFSGDGKHIVYEAPNGNNGRPEVRIAAIPASGFLNPRQLVVANAASFNSFDWSPDGRWIATTFERTDGTGQIGLISVSDGSFRSLKSVDRGVLNTLRNHTSFFVSPDGKYLAYDRPATGSLQKDVFLLAVDGSGETPAVVHSANDALMGWSPDGTRLLFRSDRTGSWALWAQSFADGTPQGLPELLKPDIGRSVSLGVTTSGALYLYKSISARDLAIAPVDLDAGRLLGPPVKFPHGFVEGPQNATWSPDGKYLAYPVDCDNGCLAIRSVATGQVRRVASTLSNVVGGPSWSPDGRSLLASGADVTGPGIFRFDVQSGEATAVIRGDRLQALQGGWSPDGTKVYFSRIDGVVERDLASGSERMVHLEAGGLRLPQLSPDGRFVFGIGVFDSSTQSASLLVVPVAGGQPRELFRVSASVGFTPGPFAWTPDSRAMLAVKNIGPRRELWLVPVSGGPHRKLDIDPSIWIAEAYGGRDIGFSLSPDGRSIVFQTGKLAVEVWALENFLPSAPARR